MMMMICSDPSQQISRVCYVRFADPMNVCVAQHLTNTVFIDRAIMVKPVHDNRIPDETLALKLANEGHLQNSSNNGVVSQVVFLKLYHHFIHIKLYFVMCLITRLKP